MDGIPPHAASDDRDGIGGGDGHARHGRGRVPAALRSSAEDGGPPHGTAAEDRGGGGGGDDGGGDSHAR
jgi:hypothetical protein